MKYTPNLTEHEWAISEQHHHTPEHEYPGVRYVDTEHRSDVEHKRPRFMP